MEDNTWQQSSPPPRSLYTKTTLAALLGITEVEAQQLMESDSFPATPITGTAYVVTPENLKSWARLNARRVDVINSGDIFKNLWPTKRPTRMEDDTCLRRK